MLLTNHAVTGAPKDCCVRYIQAVNDNDVVFSGHGNGKDRLQCYGDLRAKTRSTVVLVRPAVEAERIGLYLGIFGKV